MKALVVGATGMLGLYLVERLLQASYQVSALVRQESNTASLQPLPVEIIRGDLTQRDQIDPAVAGVDVVFHLAAYFVTTSAFNRMQTSDAYVSSFELTRLLLESSLKNGVSRFVYASSTSVYGSEAISPITEDAPLSPQTAYGRSKLSSENCVRAYQVRGLATTIIRPCIIYGAQDRHFLPGVMRLSHLPILPLINGGRALQDLVHAADVAELMLLASESPDAIGKTYNGASGSPEPFAALFETLALAVGRKPKAISIPAWLAFRAGWLARLYLRTFQPDLTMLASATGIEYLSRDVYYDISLARRDLDYQPKYNFAQGLHEALHHPPMRFSGTSG